MNAPLIVAIDGPSGVGKSSVARRLAERLGVPYVDTGAMYRALALKALRQGIDPNDVGAVSRLARDTRIDHRRVGRGDFVVQLDGEIPGEALRTSEVGEAASRVARHSEVRGLLVRLQRSCAAEQGAVMEGRDIGTVVFPETPHKFFLTADPAVRHERRFRQLEAEGRPADRRVVIDEMVERDARDSGRADSPLTCDESYVLIDTSRRTLDQVVEEMVRVVENR